MAGILRGEIRRADLNPTRGKEQSGQRPVLILSHDVFNERSGTVITVALTSQPQKKISQIRTLATERIGNRLGRSWKA
jgi:mRNA interferase MazF